MLKRQLLQPGAIAVGLLLVILMVALHLMTNAVQNSEALSRVFVPLLVLVLLGLLALALLVSVNSVRLVRALRRQAAGSRLAARLLAMFALISLLPVGVVYYYSLTFLMRGIDSWFDVEIDTAMEDALTLNQASLDLNQRILMKYSAQLLNGIQDRSATALTLTLGTLRRQAGALELTLFDRSGQVLATASDDPLQLVPNQPEREVMQHVRGGINYVSLEPGPSGELVVRVLVRDPSARPLLLQAIFPTSARITELASRLESAYNRYTELSFLRQSLKFSFSITLSLVLVFSFMAALLIAFRTARALSDPIADIAHGTRAIADGDYEQQLPLPRHDDELAFLVASFNAMTRRIAQARDEAEQSQQAVESQRAYLETLLSRLSSGVIAFDEHNTLRTSNAAARQILAIDLDDDTPMPLAALATQYPRLAHWCEIVGRRIGSGRDWREEVTLFGADGRQVLMCRGSPLPVTLSGSAEDAEPNADHVLVFDDITTLIRAQRDAAWGEVARRLAHEIKNPLTPIQLSAERLRHKLLRKLPEADAKVVDRSTHTIVQQVEAMKAMVNDFASYARTPEMQQEPFLLDKLVNEVMELYRAGPVSMSRQLEAGDAMIRGDSKRLRQVIHNLVKNAIEALEERENPRILVATRRVDEEDTPSVELRVEDNGNGIDPNFIGRLFDPYVTSKAKGTGLGLSIVKKIIEEHGGIIRADNIESGARFTARLPISTASRTPSMPQAGTS
ncbi:two-component sensor histidine kinase [Lamprobacter modestohalophilus]|uniref:histidine kinase n=1 Tax=Lamprobacter modestohalophilus TaxID=1064514 RepID=A0A9X0W9P0_9GAMM|nr:ATP-binding protein [Lamprobacter modestohalophilus]MBK1619399.1 two-component sensor histidine kinase [Lamprobacter modestohalophilus]